MYLSLIGQRLNCLKIAQKYWEIVELDVRKELRCCEGVGVFLAFPVTSDGCLPCLADHSKGLGRRVALSWKTCKQY